MKIRKVIISTLEALLGDSSKIDLAIVTHNDDDHIGRSKYLLQTSIKLVSRLNHIKLKNLKFITFN